MSIEAWLAFVAASTILLIIPGPTILLVISYALGQGWRAALPISVGVALGDFTAMTLSMLGVGALLAASATLFTVLKLIGAAYLIWLGIKLWRAGGALRTEARTETATSFSMVAHAWLVTALNPKGITFFVAFLPQFLDPTGDVLRQMLILGATFLALAFANALGYGLLAARAGAMARNPNAISLFNKIGGSLLIGAGVAAATVRT
ncbi:MAG TPA: LysE family translocator [Hyphomicrobiaceae bacterium]|jgi:threonine/homoserine/homoserine lactone efflux protein|nr:LysE family translocator [Hyphomicrobiaceae bacterium]